MPATQQGGCTSSLWVIPPPSKPGTMSLHHTTLRRHSGRNYYSGPGAGADRLGVDAEASDALFDERVWAIRAGATYANVHSSLFTPGEIRGQLPGSHDD